MFRANRVIVRNPHNKSQLEIEWRKPFEGFPHHNNASLSAYLQATRPQRLMLATLNTATSAQLAGEIEIACASLDLQTDELVLLGLGHGFIKR